MPLDNGPDFLFGPIDDRPPVGNVSFRDRPGGMTAMRFALGITGARRRFLAPLTGHDEDAPTFEALLSGKGS